MKTPVQVNVESKTSNLAKNLAAPFKFKNNYLDLKPSSDKELDSETLQLLQNLLDKKPNFTNNYVNFNRPDAFVAQWNKPVEAHSPQKQPQPEVAFNQANMAKKNDEILKAKPVDELKKAQPKKPEYVETKEDKEAVKVSKFEEHRSTKPRVPTPKVIQVVQQEPITKVIDQPKMERFDYKYIGNKEKKTGEQIVAKKGPSSENKAVVNKVEPKSLLA